MRKLYKYSAYLGRTGQLEGLFIATDDEVKSLIGKETFFGEVLGKHSQIVHTNHESEFIVKSEDPELLATLEAIFGGPDLCGLNPMNFEFN